MLSALPVPISPLSHASVATSAWRAGGQLHLTAVVKATFALAPEGRMTLLAPDPIVHDEVPDPAGLGLRAAGDLAPRLGQTDLLVTGHAEVPPRFSAPELRVWLGMVRDGAVKVDRSLELDASVRVGAARAHVHIHGAGPISREWPRRSQLLGAIDPQRLRGPLLDIPDQLDWGYFQAAPAEQRMELLRGDEWLVLGGIFAGRPRFRTQLPEARGVARVYRRGLAPPRAGEPIELVADTLQVDVDRRCASILWRGDTLVDEAELGALHVVAGVDLAGRAVVWADPFPPEAAKPIVAAAPRPVPVRPAPPAPAPEENPLEGTFMLPDDALLRLAAEPATPFQKGAENKPVVSEHVETPPRENRVAEEIPVQIAPAPPPPPELNPLAGTFQLPDDAALVLGAASATPFGAPRGPAAGEPSILSAALSMFSSAWRPATPSGTAPPRREEISPAPEDNPLAGTFTLPDDLALQVAAAPATPFEQRGGGTQEALIQNQKKLGDVFLAAMEAAGEAV